MKELLILGPPGCGKTYNLLQRVEDALDEGVSSDQIGFMSFTRKAVLEAIDRACDKFGFQEKQLPYFRTLHSLAFRELGVKTEDILRKHDWEKIGSDLGLEFNSNDKTSPDDGVLIPMIGGSGGKYAQMIDRAKYRLVTLEQEYSESQDYDLSFSKLKQISGTLENYKMTYGKFGFVDLIEQYLSLDPPHLKLLIIDEAQDLTPLQWAMVEKLKENTDEIVYAGDDDQAIHRWTGVDVKQFMESCSFKTVLSQSYRLPKSILEVANSISARITHRVPKEFKPREGDEGKVVHHMGLETVPLHEGSWTLMFRTNALLSHFAKRLQDQGHLISVKGNWSVTEDQVETILAWRDLQAGKSLTLFQVKKLYAQVPKLGDHKVVKRGASSLLDAADPEECFTHKKLVESYNMIAPLERDAFEVAKLGYHQQIHVRSAERNGHDISKPPRIKLSTFHAMKGGEDDNCLVYLGSSRACVESAYRDFDKADDEHRAFYVGVSRAKKELHILDAGTQVYRYEL